MPSTGVIYGKIHYANLYTSVFALETIHKMLCHLGIILKNFQCVFSIIMLKKEILPIVYFLDLPCHPLPYGGEYGSHSCFLYLPYL
jgi:hypothetical protein